eukprot:TRINITY_DN94047_c0_g1_i1.p1 TRINITY_DN94047_c0_g1~~TRINITY_DN94047_c0_g1_i1.p1  ORF type:complete len:507 (+),score=92.07 TRINITY_DN94047_c0_g1_i1:90-1610(+)
MWRRHSKKKPTNHDKRVAKILSEARIREVLHDKKVTVDEAKRLLQQVGLSGDGVDAVVGNFYIKLDELLDHIWADEDPEGQLDDGSSLTPAAKEVLKNIFVTCVVDGSRDATRAELGETLRRYMDFADHWGLPKITKDVEDTTIDRFFRDADLNGDMHLSWEEFFKHVKVTMEQSKSFATNGTEGKRYQGRVPTNVELSQNGASHIEINDWFLDYWKLTGPQEFSLLLQVLDDWSLNQLCETPVDPTAMHHFFAAVKREYHSNPYHGFHHALSTLHLTFKFVQSSNNSLQPTSLFALAVSALCHDIGHRGFNNAFEIVSQSDAALRYNDRSPLENHSCARAFEISLRTTEDTRIFKDWDPKAYSRVRQLMVSAILATDMACHTDHVNKLNVMSEIPDDTSLLVDLFLHAADIGHAVSPLENNLRWTAGVQAEFTAQVAAERSLGLPVSAFMDGLEDPRKAAKSQIGFFDFVILPLFSPLFNLFPGLEEAEDNLSTNRKKQLEIAES